ncbi:hypothetical protein Tco_0681173 [Tanacetum coccineum]|uniref:Uncharacterized protein n=1 Tax=Tanacetum coccineum TaxID=301880 RepID=A0ABQ4XML4_9ASTR
MTTSSSLLTLLLTYFFVYAYMDLLAFIQVANPTKVKVGEREHDEGVAKLLYSIVGHVVSLLPVTRARADSELEASVDRLFDEGGSADQGDSAVAGGQETEIKLVTGVRIVADENGGHGTFSGAATGGKSPSVLKELLASSMLNVEVGVAAVATLPLVTCSVSATPELESGVPTDSITGLNLRTIRASERFIISSDSSHHSSTNASRAEGDSIIRSAIVPLVMIEAVVTSHAVNAPSVPVSKSGTKIPSLVHASMFHDSDSTKTMKADTAEFVDHLAPPTLFSQIYEMDYHHLFTEFNVGTARQACLNAEVRMRTKYCLSERKRLESECEKQADLLKVRDEEVENLKARLLLKETKAAEAARLRVQVDVAEATEKMHVDEIDALKQRNEVLENEKDSLDRKVADLQSLVSTKDLELKDLNVALSSLRSQKDSLVDQVHALETTCSGLRDQVAKLDADLLEMALHLEEKFYPHLLTTISGRRMDCRPRLYEVEFPLLTELKSHKDASTADVMNLLRLEGPLADAPGMSDLQPDVEQLTLPNHHPEDQVVLGEASTSGSMPAAVVTTTALSTTFVAVSSVLPITIEDYEIVVQMIQRMLREMVREMLLLSPQLNLKRRNRGRIAAYSLLSSKRSRLIPKASLFCTISTSAVLSVGMPISTGMTASVQYVSEKGVSPLLDLIIVPCAQRTWEISSIQILLLASSLALIPSPKL